MITWGLLGLVGIPSPGEVYHIVTQGIEQLVTELKEKMTIIIVTHNMQQAARVSD